jgi:dihydroorotate dehydrogenase
MEKLVALRQKIVKYLYKNFARRIFFIFDAELMHNVFIWVGKTLGRYWITKNVTSVFFNYQNEKILGQRILGMNFRNPVGLAAGFDKDAKMISIMEDVGFGFSEAGSVSAGGCSGNKGRRMGRFVKEESLWINFGLNNEGAMKISSRLQGKKYEIPFGVSIARTNSRETIDENVAIEDFCFSAEKFRNIGDYLTINISCPNAYGGQPFSDARRFERLIRKINKLKIKKPIFVKLSPNLNKEEVNAILKLSEKYSISGFICTNLMKDKRYESGGISGKLLEKKSDEMLQYVYSRALKMKKKFILIGCGGISSAEDAYKKIKLGANLVQLITGMIFEGPELIGEINYGLTQLLKRDRYSNISEAVGKDTE